MKILPASTPKSSNDAKVRFDSTTYTRAHGRLPYGFGSWCFCPKASYYASDYLDKTVQVEGCMKLSDAKKVAANHFAEIGELEIVICP